MLTAFKVTGSVDAFPGAGTSAEDAAGQPSGTDICARAAAYPSPLLLTNSKCLTWAGPCSHALAVTDDRGRIAYARGRVDSRGGGESACAREIAGISIRTGGSAVFWPDAF